MSKTEGCQVWLTSGIAEVWRRRFLRRVREPDEGYCEVEGVFLFWHRRGGDRLEDAWREAEAEGCDLDYLSYAGVAWDLAPDAGVRVALCGITVVDGSEQWRPRPGVPVFASSWAAQREPVRWSTSARTRTPPARSAASAALVAAVAGCVSRWPPSGATPQAVERVVKRRSLVDQLLVTARGQRETAQ